MLPKEVVQVKRDKSKYPFPFRQFNQSCLACDKEETKKNGCQNF